MPLRRQQIAEVLTKEIKYYEAAEYRTDYQKGFLLGLKAALGIILQIPDDKKKKKEDKI